jgi:hypothetical protein
MKRSAFGAARHGILFLVICISVVVTTGSYGAALPENINSIMDNCRKVTNGRHFGGLRKTRAIGQVPASGSPVASSFGDINGLQESIEQDWDSARAVWKNVKRDVFTWNEDENVTKVDGYRFNDTLNEWYIRYRNVLTYYKPGKMAGMVEESFASGTWKPTIKMTIGYNEIDTPINFVNIQWDSDNELWDTTTGVISYNQSGLMDTVNVIVNNGGSIVEVKMVYTYYSDKKLHTEDISGRLGPNTFRNGYVHYYPDEWTEAIVSQDYYSGSGWSTNDSTVNYYTAFGLIDTAIIYVMYSEYKDSVVTYHTVANRSKTTTFDEKNRPIERIERKLISGVLKERILFNYDGNHIRIKRGNGNSFDSFGCSFKSKRVVVVHGLARIENGERAFVRIYDAKGAVIHSCSAIIANCALKFQLHRAPTAGVYICSITDKSGISMVKTMPTW